MELERIELLARQNRYDEALAFCEKLLQGDQENTTNILRTRAFIFARSGQYEYAMQDFQTIFGMGEGAISDYYLAATHALSARQFTQAITWLEEVLRLGKEQQEEWFESATYFLLAYAQMELGQLPEAIMNLNLAVAVDADVAMPLPRRRGIYSHKQLRDEIERRTPKNRVEK
jgi:tetratricopeptide (TPR) repeat protein